MLKHQNFRIKLRGVNLSLINSVRTYVYEPYDTYTCHQKGTITCYAQFNIQNIMAPCVTFDI